jgi:hypothetical protein
VAAINLPLRLTSLSVVVVVVLAVVGRVVSAILPRAGYAAIELKLAENRKTASGVGVFFMTAAFPVVGGTMEKLIKAMIS